MARFTGSATQQAPLLFQLGAVPAGGVAHLVEVEVTGDNETGSASNPALYIPSAPGTGGETFATNENGQAAVVPYQFNFSISPSTPIMPAATAFNLPVRKQIIWPRFSPFIIYGNSALAIHANASGGHTWSVRVVWEER